MVNGKRKTKERKEGGITLIVLVITIIVFLILAGVTIAFLSGPNGIIQKSIEAKLETRGGEVEEKIKLWKTEYQTSKYIDGMQVKKEDEMLNELLDQKLIFNEEIDKENKIITIGSKEINYKLEDITIKEIDMPRELYAFDGDLNSNGTAENIKMLCADNSDSPIADIILQIVLQDSYNAILDDWYMKNVMKDANKSFQEYINEEYNNGTVDKIYSSAYEYLKDTEGEDIAKNVLLLAIQEYGIDIQDILDTIEIYYPDGTSFNDNYNAQVIIENSGEKICQAKYNGIEYKLKFNVNQYELIQNLNYNYIYDFVNKKVVKINSIEIPELEVDLNQFIDNYNGNTIISGELSDIIPYDFMFGEDGIEMIVNTDEGEINLHFSVIRRIQ